MTRRRRVLAGLGVLAFASHAAADQGGAPAPWLGLPSTPPLPPDGRSRVLTVNGCKLFVSEFGEGEPVLFLHGGLANANYWGNQIPRAARNFHVIAMDTRGHGRSMPTSQPFSYGLLAADAIGVLDQLGLRRASIVGWSDGAIVGLQIAQTYPDRLGSLFAFGANFSPEGLKHDGSHSPVFAAFVQRSAEEYRLLSPEPARYGALRAGLGRMWSTEPRYARAELAGIKASVAVADGSHDEIIQPAHTKALAEAIPGAKLIIEPDASHFAMLQTPERFTDSVLAFLSG